MSSNSSIYASATSVSRKVAIPRLQRPGQVQNPSRERRRVPRACTACRSHKIKCTGDTPRCKHCEVTGRECVYILPRKDRLKCVTERCSRMAALLNDLKARATEEDGARIIELLDAVEDDVSEIRQTPVPSVPDTDADDSTKELGAPPDIGSVESLDALGGDSLDLLDEDLLKDERARATGFVGKNSEIQWLRSIMLQLERADEDGARTTIHGIPSMIPERRGSSFGQASIDQISSFTFYLDSENVDLDFFVDPYELPPPEMAERLLDCYMATVHDSFPILPRKLFEDQVKRYFRAMQGGDAMRLSPKWQAILNLVFAIGAKYSHLAAASWAADQRDHLIYQARARAFGLESTLTNHPDVPQIQVMGLLAFYYLTVGQISRAWVVLGMALRFANALGLHVRNEDPSATAQKREMLVRIWWSLYTLERLLSVMTGRPSVIVDSCCSVPLPSPLSDEQIEEIRLARQTPSSPTSGSTSVTSPTMSIWSSSTVRNVSPIHGGMSGGEANLGSYFKAVVQISIVTQNILSSLYSVGTMIRPLGEIQHDMLQLGQRLDNWLVSLPAEFNFQRQASGQSPPRGFVRERTILAFHFGSARMLLTRPCLNGLGQGEKELHMPTGFAGRMAGICISTAKVMIDLLPDEPHPPFIYERGPWWCLVHHMMQAVSVLLLGIMYIGTPSHDSNMLVEYVKKSVRWLQTMRKDPLADSAYQMALRTLQAVRGRLSLDLSDLYLNESIVFPPPDPTTGGANNAEPFVRTTTGAQRQTHFAPAAASHISTSSGTASVPTAYRPFLGFSAQADAFSFEGAPGPHYYHTS